LTRIQEWDERYRAGEQVFRTPSPLVVEFAQLLPAGSALDLASGPGRNAIYLAERGWHVTAVDGSSVAMELLRARNLSIDALVADLERHEFAFAPESYDLILSCYYFQRSLIPAMKLALRPGGLLIMIAHLSGRDQPHGSPTRASSGELRASFPEWRVLQYREGEPDESYHRHAVAELVARKPQFESGRG
jgi:tellurite methyltransferase